MGTVDKSIADRVIAGEFPEDEAMRIVQYDNEFGSDNFGVTCKGEDHSKYLEETFFVRRPRIYWESEEMKAQGVEEDALLKELLG